MANSEIHSNTGSYKKIRKSMNQQIKDIYWIWILGKGTTIKFQDKIEIIRSQTIIICR